MKNTELFRSISSMVGKPGGGGGWWTGEGRTCIVFMVVCMEHKKYVVCALSATLFCMYVCM